MNRRYSLILAMAVFIVLAAAASGAYAESLWVTSEHTALKAGRSISAATLAELKRGTQLTLLDYESRWYRVSTPGGRTGWVYRGKVSDTPPEQSGQPKGEGGGIGDLLGGLSGSSVEADAADSARSIRGLSPEAEAYAKKSGTPEQSRKALDRVLSMSVTENEVDAFLKAGQVGEYAQ